MYIFSFNLKFLNESTVLTAWLYHTIKKKLKKYNFKINS